MPLTLDAQAETPHARRKREAEIREWYAIVCECIRDRDRDGLQIAKKELAARGVFLYTTILDPEPRP